MLFCHAQSYFGNKIDLSNLERNHFTIALITNYNHCGLGITNVIKIQIGFDTIQQKYSIRFD